MHLHDVIFTLAINDKSKHAIITDERAGGMRRHLTERSVECASVAVFSKYLTGTSRNTFILMVY